MRIFAGDRVKAIMDRLKMPEGEAIEAGIVTRSIESAQRKVEARNFDIRKNVLEYDDVPGTYGDGEAYVLRTSTRVATAMTPYGVIADLSREIEQLHKRFGEDDELAAFYALSLLGTMVPGENTVPTRMRAGSVALEVLAIGKLRYDALFPCLMAAVVADQITRLWGIHHTTYAVDIVPASTAANILQVILAGAVFGAGRVAGLTGGLGPIHPRRHALWVVAGGLFKVRFGGGRAPESEQGQAQVVADGGVVRGQPHGVQKVGQGLFPPPTRKEGDAEHLPAEGRTGVTAGAVARGAFECFKLAG